MRRHSASKWLHCSALTPSAPPTARRHLPGLALGLRPGADLLGGIAAEFALGAVITWVVLACDELRCG